MASELQALARCMPSEAKKRIESAVQVAGTAELAARMLGVSRRTLYRVASQVGASTTPGEQPDTCPAPDTCPRTGVRSASGGRS